MPQCTLCARRAAQSALSRRKEPIAQPGGQVPSSSRRSRSRQDDTPPRAHRCKFRADPCLTALLRGRVELPCRAARADMRPIDGRILSSTMSLRGFDGHGFISSAERQVPERRRCPRTGANAPEWCFAAPHPAAPSNISSPKSASPWSASAAGGDTASRRRTRRALLPVSRAPGVGGILKPEVG